MRIPGLVARCRCVAGSSQGYGERESLCPFWNAAMQVDDKTHALINRVPHTPIAGLTGFATQ